MLLLLMSKSSENSFSAGGLELPRRKFLALLGAALSIPPSLRAAAKGPPPKPQNVISAAEALNRLMIGNSRYVCVGPGGTTRPEPQGHKPAIARNRRVLPVPGGADDDHALPQRDLYVLLAKHRAA